MFGEETCLIYIMSHEERERLNEIGRQLFYHFLTEVHVSFVNNSLAQLLLNSDAVFEYRNVPGYNDY